MTVFFIKRKCVPLNCGVKLFQPTNNSHGLLIKWNQDNSNGRGDILGYKGRFDIR